MSLEKIADDLVETESRVLRDTIDDIYALTVEDKTERIAKLPENVFVKTFLPHIAGLEEESDVTLMKYVEYAGSAFNEVDIIDAGGNTLFTAPSLYARTDIKTENNNVPYSEIASTYELKKARMPAEAANYMKNVSNAIENEIGEIDSTSNEMRWNKIFKRYLADDLDALDEDEAVVAILGESDLDEIIDYD